MGYYTGARGDYYTGRGDLFKKIKSGFKKLSRINPALGGGLTRTNRAMGGALAQGFLPGVGAVLGGAGGGSALGSLAGTVLRRFGVPTALATAGGAYLESQVGGGGGGGGGGEYIPASEDNPLIPNVIEGLWDARPRKRRAMNAANVHALRRALRRVDSFRNLAKKSGAMPAARRLPPQRERHCCK